MGNSLVIAQADARESKLPPNPGRRNQCGVPSVIAVIGTNVIGNSTPRQASSARVLQLPYKSLPKLQHPKLPLSRDHDGRLTSRWSASFSNHHPVTFPCSPRLAE